jgi:hypothetical protein
MIGFELGYLLIEIRAFLLALDEAALLVRLDIRLRGLAAGAHPTPSEECDKKGPHAHFGQIGPTEAEQLGDFFEVVPVHQEMIFKCIEKQRPLADRRDFAIVLSPGRDGRQ